MENCPDNLIYYTTSLSNKNFSSIFKSIIKKLVIEIGGSFNLV